MLLEWNEARQAYKEAMALATTDSDRYIKDSCLLYSIILRRLLLLFVVLFADT